MTAHAIPTTDQRLHGLDALRGGALLLGVVLHATVSYLPGAQYWWIVSDSAQSLALSATFFTIHTFRMTTFFLLAGFFGALLLRRIGYRAFVYDRLRRIALPLLAGWPIVFGAIVAVVVWSALLKFGGQLPKESPPGPAFTADDFPLTHLWFLYQLLWLYAAMLVARTVLSQLDRSGRVQAALDRVVAGVLGPLAPALLAIPVALALLSTSRWYAWFGVPTPDQTLYPQLASSVCYGLAFAVGWALQRQRGLLVALAARWPVHLGIAIAATATCLWQLGLSSPARVAELDAQTALYAYTYALASWSWTLGLVGLTLQHFATANRARRYVADASYWIYLAHLPLVMALQVAASRIDAPWWIEFPLLLTVALAVLFASYHWLVRGRAIGRFLGERTSPANLPSPAAAIAR